MKHQVIIVGTDSKRIAVLDAPEERFWVAPCEELARKYLIENGYKKAGRSHISNGNLIVWVFV